MEMSTSGPSAGSTGNGVVGVRYSAFNQPGKHAGKPVSQIRQELGGIWGIPGDAQAFVNDKKVDDGYQLQEGDQLVYHRKSGDKGVG